MSQHEEKGRLQMLVAPCPPSVQRRGFRELGRRPMHRTIDGKEVLIYTLVVCEQAGTKKIGFVKLQPPTTGVKLRDIQFSLEPEEAEFLRYLLNRPIPASGRAKKRTPPIEP